MSQGFNGFPPETLRFLRDLKRNNNREWFLAHKQAYEAHVKAPMIGLVESLGGALQLIAPELVVDPKRAIYRIYRDTRFSPDKTPYKTSVAAIFAPRGLPKHGGASLYFHVTPEELIIAGGVYMPEASQLLAIRRHVADHCPELLKIIGAKDFKKMFGEMEGEKLVRPPKSFPPDHPAIDMLRFKQYFVAISDTPKLAEGPKFLPLLLKSFALMIPFVRFLNAPLFANAGNLLEREASLH